LAVVEVVPTAIKEFRRIGYAHRGLSLLKYYERALSIQNILDPQRLSTGK
jgi:hypothetical protein